MICITVTYSKVKGKSKLYRYYQPATYKYHNGKWKYVRHVGIARRSERLARLDCLNYDLPFIENIRHNNPIKKEHLCQFICRESQCLKIELL